MPIAHIPAPCCPITHRWMTTWNQQIERGEWISIECPSFEGMVFGYCSHYTIRSCDNPGYHMEDFTHQKKSSYLAEYLYRRLLVHHPFTQDVEDTLLRLFGPRQPHNEAIWYVNPSRLYYDMKYERIRPNDGKSDMPLLMNYTNPLWIQLYQHDYHPVQLLLDLLAWGEDINGQNYEGLTTLMWFVLCMNYIPEFQGPRRDTIRETCFALLDILLRKGADVLLTDREGDSAWSLTALIHDPVLKQRTTALLAPYAQ